MHRLSCTIFLILPECRRIVEACQAAEEQIEYACRTSFFGLRNSLCNSDIIVKAYQRAIRTVDGILQYMIIETETRGHVVNAIETQLKTLSWILYREQHTNRGEHASVSSSVWTVLGGNQGLLQALSAQRVSLQNVIAWRQASSAKVISTQLNLKSVQHDMQYLSEEIGRKGSKEHALIELRSLQKGVQEIQKYRQQANLGRAQIHHVPYN